MEIEITKPIHLTDVQSHLLDLHSFLNVLNILVGELILISLEEGSGQALPQTTRMAAQLRDRMISDVSQPGLLDDVAGIETCFASELGQLQEKRPDLRKDPEIHESLSNIRSVLRVLQVRLREYRLRQQLSSEWVAHSVRELRENLELFLMAVEKNARGRYHIVFNIAQQAERDYVVHIQLDPAPDGFIHGPAPLGDILRDLSANARKYTLPGGKLDIGIQDDGHRMRMVVEDTGVGIPADEIERVVEFGCRGRNVSRLPTKGGGFGLTKAYVLVRKFGGRMWIASREGEGTRITIEIPHPTA